MIYEPQTTHARIIRMGAAGELQKNIASECGVSQPTVSIVLRNAGIYSQGRRISQSKIQSINHRLSIGEQQTKIALDLGIAQSTVSRVAKRNNGLPSPTRP